MGQKRTPGLQKRYGRWYIDKIISGYGRLSEPTGTSDLGEAERYLAHRLEEIRQAGVYGVRKKRTLGEAILKYVKSEKKKSLMTTDIYLLKPVGEMLGALPLDRVHDETLEPLVSALKRKGWKDKSVNLCLGAIRRILNLAAKKWRDEHSNLTWLTNAPSLTIRKPRDQRPPYPITVEEQRKVLLPECPDHVARAVLFMVNTGVREREYCELRWRWEVMVPGMDASVFVLPDEYSKNGIPRLIVLNRTARSIVDACRGQHPEFVFSWRGQPQKSVNNTAWVNARARAVQRYKRELSIVAPEGFATLHVHDLRHTFGSRLRAAGVGFETRQDLLGHANGNITTHYSMAQVKELVDAVRRLDDVGSNEASVAFIRVAHG